MSRRFMQIVDGPVGVRREPNLNAERLGELATGTIIEIVAENRVRADGFDWVQHHFGWSVRDGVDEGVVFMQDVPESLALHDPKAVLLAPMVAQAPSAPVLQYLQVVDGGISVRTEPRTHAARVAELPLGAVIAVDANSRTLADGFIWWRHDQGWSAGSTDTGLEVYLEPVAQAADEQPLEDENPHEVDTLVSMQAVEMPDLNLAATGTLFFKVVMGPVTVRERPDVNSPKLGEFPNDVVIEVIAGSRVVSGDYVYWQHGTGWSAEGRTTGDQKFMVQVTDAPPVLEVPALNLPTFTPQSIQFLKVVDGPVNIRSQPSPASDKLGAIPNDAVIEVDGASRTIGDGYIFYKHSRGWSALGPVTGNPYMVPVDVLMPDVVVTLPNVPLGVFQVINGPINVRATPDATAEKLGQLPLYVTIEIDKNSRTERGGYVWWRHNLGWSIERRSDNSQVYMVRVPVMLNPPLTRPGTWDDGTPYRYFEITTGPLTIRNGPDTAAARVGTLYKREQIEVDPSTRMVMKGYVWWKHAQGWSAERPVAGTNTYMTPLRRLTQAPSTGGFTPFPIFLRHPLPLNDTQWIQYYGNTRFAQNLRAQRKYWYDYSQGLHGGFDYGCNRAVPIYAGVEGQIIDVRYNTSVYAPNFTRVRVGPFMVIYGHMAAPQHFKAGDTVMPDTVLGLIEAGGQNHLHLEVRYQSQIINPLLVMPAAMAQEITNRWRDYDKHFYSDNVWNRWLTPFDQPILLLQQDGKEIIIGPHA